MSIDIFEKTTKPTAHISLWMAELTCVFAFHEVAMLEGSSNPGRTVKPPWEGGFSFKIGGSILAVCFAQLRWWLRLKEMAAGGSAPVRFLGAAQMAN